MFLPEVGGTTGFGMPFNVCGNCPVANAVIGLMYVPCAVAAAISAACCYNIKRIEMLEKNILLLEVYIYIYFFIVNSANKITIEKPYFENHSQNRSYLFC